MVDAYLETACKKSNHRPNRLLLPLGIVGMAEELLTSYCWCVFSKTQLLDRTDSYHSVLYKVYLRKINLLPEPGNSAHISRHYSQIYSYNHKHQP